MRFTILTLFPDAFESLLRSSLFGKAVEAGVLEVELVNIRDFAPSKHRVVDDTPYGGGCGMVMKVEPVAYAIDSVRSQYDDVRVLLMTPQGQPLEQTRIHHLANHPHLALVCGRYEGVDERVRSLVDEELSIGDFVLSGGEPAAWVVMDAVSRFVPGFLGCADSLVEESFSESGWLEYPQYTRPRLFRGQEVPDVLLTGDHGAIATWRRKRSLLRTMRRRADLICYESLSVEEKQWLADFNQNEAGQSQLNELEKDKD